MDSEALEYLKYPIGKFEVPSSITMTHIEKWVAVLEDFPKQLISLVGNLTEEQLDTPYRPEGWTIRQVVHHISDSHHHSYTRFKWALTEDKPIIKAYFEERWAELNDSKSAPILLSLNAITALHAKLVYVLKELSFEELKQVFIHPEGSKEVSLAKNIGIYAWHSQHHYAHIEQLLLRKKWI